MCHVNDATVVPRKASLPQKQCTPYTTENSWCSIGSGEVGVNVSLVCVTLLEKNNTKVVLLAAYSFIDYFV